MRSFLPKTTPSGFPDGVVYINDYVKN